MGQYVVLDTMPKKVKELSAMSVAKIKGNGRHAVDGVDGLHLRIVNNSRAWVLRVAVGQRRDNNGQLKIHHRDIGLGSYPEVSLAEAREKARKLKLQIRNGIDPIKHKLEQLESLRIQKQREKLLLNVPKLLLPTRHENLKIKNILNNGLQHWKPTSIQL